MHAVLYVFKMSWMSFLCLATAFLDLCRGHNTLFEGYDLSMSSYHLCTRHESTVVSKVLSYKISYTVRRSCGGWLPWKMCEVTVYKKAYRTEYMNVTKDVLRCCDGYEQVGSYCALPMNRSGEFTAKPGSCPKGVVEAPRSGGCEWDLDCPGWQKCCQGEGLSLCTDPQSAGSRGWCFHVTVTAKIDYQRLISMDVGILNHTRLLHSVVTGALDSYDISVYYISSWPIWPFRTSSSLLISSPEILSLSNTTTKLHLLLIHIEEVTSVSVEDMNECSHAALSSCSRQADCSNTEGSYSCTCHPGLIDLNPNNKGVHCQAADPVTSPMPNNATHMFWWANATELPPNSTSYQSWVSSFTDTPTAIATTTDRSMMLSSTHIPATTHNPVKASSKRSETSTAVTPSSTVLTSSRPEISTALTSWSSSTSLQNTTNPNSPTLSTSAPSVPAWQTHHQQTSTMPQTSLDPTLVVSLSVSPPSPSTCNPAPITNLQASNVTGSSFCVSWMTGQSQSGFSFLVVLMEGSKVRGRWETGLSVWEVTLLKPGVLYNVTVISCPYGSQGASLLLLVKTAAQTLGATAHLTNVQFTDALLDPTSQAYQNLSRSIMEEILQSLPPDILALVNSGDVRVQITGLAPGSVVVNFTIIFTPSQSQDILKVSSALMQALQNSSRYTVDSNNTSIDDVDECSTGNMDCSPWAQCTNTWGSYSCLCLDGFTDSNPSRPGRGCSAPLTTTTPMSTTTTNTLVTISNTVSTTTTYNTTSITSNNTDAVTTNAPVTTTVNNTVRINNTVSTKTPVTITAPVPTKMTSGLMKTSLQPETPTSLAPLVSYTEAISVECRASAITVTVARDFLWSGHIGDSSLFLGRQECGVNGGNSSHVQLTVAWDECNTQLLYNSTHYTAQVNLYNSMSSQLLPDDTTRVPTVRLKVPIMCTFRRSIIIISSGYSTTGYDMIKDAVMGSGTFYVTFQLLNGMSPLPQNYSLSPEEDVVVEVSVDSTVAQIKVVINKCWATQSSNPLEPTTYVFLENSCPLPNTYTTVVENGNSRKSRLSLRIFSYINLNVIYLHCQIQICIETGSATCQPDCFGRTERFSSLIGTAKASCGPLLRSHKVSVKERSDTLRLVGYSLLGIGLFLLFIGSLSSLFFSHRKRIGTYSFSLKPKQDNSPYHVFDI
ncbi:uromodulin-like 1 isoform X1 [Salmo salar]|uniref:Uromodulin-like 1 isoform X1 n=2 Tax=Salmo salar TaxID=8030 RepID=A0ABM3CNP7_SALSA|nr:uromodulin-like 1 isoform X1 [Salmo salar]